MTFESNFFLMFSHMTFFNDYFILYLLSMKIYDCASIIKQSNLLFNSQIKFKILENGQRFTFYSVMHSLVYAIWKFSEFAHSFNSFILQKTTLL